MILLTGRTAQTRLERLYSTENDFEDKKRWSKEIILNIQYVKKCVKK